MIHQRAGCDAPDNSRVRCSWVKKPCKSNQDEGAMHLI